MATVSFAVPSFIPQDLQLIQDIIGPIPGPSTSKIIEDTQDSDHDHGTDSGTDSEQEVEADILGDTVGPDGDGPDESTSDSDSSSDSDSESDPGERRRPPPKTPIDVDVEDDDEGGPAVTSESQVRTKNELVDVDVVIPEISEVGPHEHLEKVGEVMNIVDKVAIIKGIPSSIANRGSEKALDSDTLLVFEDRKVLGFIFETFGPTSEPLYQVRFSQKHPLDPEKVRVGRPVFHVPAKSHYVFVQQIRQFKGSDASNVHDEEPGDDELEFSDDEEEAAHKRANSHRREHSRARSIASSSRHATPVPSLMRDQDMVDDPYGGTSYDEPRHNDLDLGAGPSRPAPTPYDDPYSDAYGAAPPEVKTEDEDRTVASPALPESSRGRGRGGRGRGGPPRDYPPNRDDSSRGRGRGRRQNDRGRGRGRGRGSDHRVHSDSWNGQPGAYDHPPRPLSPTSLAIARATGQFADGPPVPTDMGSYGGGGWGYGQYPMPAFDFSYPPQYPYPHVQPHINPRFAANFGMAGMGMGMGYGGYVPPSAPYSTDSSGYAVGGPGPWNNSGDWNPPHAPHPTDGSGENA